MISATIVKQSINDKTGHVLTTIRAVYPRIILAEVNTHRKFSKNTASSRAIPTWKLRRDVLENTFIPHHIGANRPGMQATEELEGWRRYLAKKVIGFSMFAMVGTHILLEKLGCHKQVANRYIEPWMYVTQLISSTEWDNFFNQRFHKDAEPHIYLLAEKIRECMHSHKPAPLFPGQWHTPFPDSAEIVTSSPGFLPYNHENILSLKASSANCARLSYELPGTTIKANFADNLNLFNKLAGANPKHLSPLEHVAQASLTEKGSGNFDGFIQLRKFYE